MAPEEVELGKTKFFFFWGGVGGRDSRRRCRFSASYPCPSEGKREAAVLDVVQYNDVAFFIFVF